MNDDKFNKAQINWEILIQHSDLLKWQVTCEYLTIEIDALSAIEAINLVNKIVQVLEAMFP